MEKLKSIYEETIPSRRGFILYLITSFERLMEEQSQRKLEKFKRYLRQTIVCLEIYDPFAESINLEKFEDYEDEEEIDE